MFSICCFQTLKTERLPAHLVAQGIVSFLQREAERDPRITRADHVFDLLFPDIPPPDEGFLRHLLVVDCLSKALKSNDNLLGVRVT